MTLFTTGNDIQLCVNDDVQLILIVLTHNTYVYAQDMVAKNMKKISINLLPKMVHLRDAKLKKKTFFC